MTPDSPKSIAFAFSFMLALAAPLGAQNATGQLESAESQPGKTYDNAAPGSQPVSAADGRGAGRRPNLKMSTKPEKIVEEPAPVTGEDRAVTKPQPKPSFLDSKWAWAGISAVTFGVLGFLALGPWGILGGAVLGAAVGFFSHGKSWFNIF